MNNRKIKVVIVDDQALVLDILKKGLSQNSSIEVVGTATNGFLAFNEVNRTEPDVIILDMEMPTMNGIQFLQRMMPINPVPTIVLSALTERDSQITQDAFEAGAVDFLPKPTGGAKALPQLLSQLILKIKNAADKDVSHFKRKKEHIVKEEKVDEKTLPPTVLDRKAKTDKIILGMGALDASNDKNKSIRIYALGSCVGVSLFSKSKDIAGMCHVVLPSSSADKEKAQKVPGYYADSGIDALLEKMLELGCRKDDIVAKIAGGAKTKAEIGDYFGIGQRNAVAVKAALIKHNIKILGEDTGKDISRTVSIRPGIIEVEIQHPEKGKWII
jgi:chemotaxis receptor (MCP) glutamine deamidase CheD/DNA-binding NarL/FixJ family response regulator